ncbi:MAG: GAF domain-containing protein, partial [Algicola sp.]|nr:GAF domain-containing protein [Algicola sp.]
RDAQDPTSLSGSSVMSMFEDSKNNLWVSTNSGLNKFNRSQGNFARYRKKQGLSNNQVYGVLEDNDGFLWIITNYGLNRYDPDTGTVKLYTQQDGLQNNEFNAAAFYKLSDGQLMVGGVNGFNVFDPRKIKTNPFPPKIMITNFRISNQTVPVGLFKYKKTEEVLLDKSINFTKQINLSHEESVFSFEFAALHYSAPTLNQFQYRLLGFDSNWTTTDYKNRRATYTNLAAGKYTFEIKAANKDGVWSPDPATIALTIRPPWWLTKTAKFVWLALFFITVNVAYRLKTNQIRKQKTELQLQVSRQVAQVVQQKRALETSYNDIKVLSSIGQRINSSLDLEKVLWAVYEDINKLMDGTIFGIGLYQPGENRIKIKLAMEKGNRYKPYYRSMEDKNQFPVWCIEHDEVVFVNDLELDGRRYLQQHEYDDPEGSKVQLENGSFSEVPQSFIYVPMRSPDKVLGFLAVQSFHRHAYQDVHIDILKTLATYTGTAIVNAKEHQELLDSRKELIESEKMASLGALTAGVAHEINNPTNFVHVSAQNLEVDLERFQEYVMALAGDDADEAILMDFRQQFAPLYGHIATIQDGTERIKTIVHDLRAFTHLDAVNKRKVSITENILSTIHLVQTQFSEVAEFITEFNDDPQLVCYPSQLNQVYMNLIVNACDAIRDKQSQQGNKEKGKIIIGCRSLIDNVEITIQDNGNGMSEATKKRLFEPFYTTKEVGKGSGLGLSISYGIVKKHHGQLTADALEGVGTTFRLLLPYQTKPVTPEAQTVEDDDEVLNIE